MNVSQSTGCAKQILRPTSQFRGETHFSYVSVLLSILGSYVSVLLSILGSYVSVLLSILGSYDIQFGYSVNKKFSLQNFFHLQKCHLALLLRITHFSQ